jgi:hypothetical protein
MKGQVNMATVGSRAERPSYESVEAYLLDLAKDVALLVKNRRVMDHFREQLGLYNDMWARWETVQKADQERRWEPSMGKPEHPLDVFKATHSTPYDPEKESKQLPAFYSLLAFIHDPRLSHLPQINSGIVTDEEVVKQTLSACGNALDDRFIGPGDHGCPDIREARAIERCFNCVTIDLKEYLRREGRTEREAAAILHRQIKSLSPAELIERLAALFEKRAEHLLQENETWRDMDRSLRPWFDEALSCLDAVTYNGVGLLRYQHDNLLYLARGMQIRRFRGHYTDASIVSSAHGYAAELAEAFGYLARRMKVSTTTFHAQPPSGTGQETAKPPTETQPRTHKKVKRSIRDRFAFEPGRACFDNDDLGLPSGEPVKMLETLVQNYGSVVKYTGFNQHYRSACPGTVHKSKHIIEGCLAKHHIPCKLITKTGEGYLIQDMPTQTIRKKRVYK